MIFKIIYFEEEDFYRRYPQLDGQDEDGRSNLGFSTDSMKNYQKKEMKSFIVRALYSDGDGVIFDSTSEHLAEEIRSDLQSRVEKATKALEKLPSK